MKNNRLSRIISLALTVAMLCALVLPGTAVASAAGETYQKTNLIADPNFDLSEGFVTDHTLGRWNNYNLDKTTDGRSGSGAKFTGTRRPPWSTTLTEPPSLPVRPISSPFGSRPLPGPCRWARKISVVPRQ